jgi:hypothetical protein
MVGGVQVLTLDKEGCRFVSKMKRKIIKQTSVKDKTAYNYGRIKALTK